SPELVEQPLGGSPMAFSQEEIDQLRGELESLLPWYTTLSPSFKYGFQEGMLRFNRVEGLSAGIGAELPITPLLTLYGEARLGVADLHPNGELSIIHGPADRRTSLTGYRRLAFVSDWSNHHSLGTSLLNLATGDDRGFYYRTQGIELARANEGRSVRREFRLFLEEHGSADRETSFHLFKPITHDTLPSNIRAQEGTVYGGAGTLRWQAGEPPGLIASGMIRGEVTGGDFAYQRALTSIALTRPLFAGLAGALEAGIGAGWGDLPIQRNFFLGGPYTLRGLENGSVVGESFWMVRGEVGSDVPAARVTLFSDVGWAGPRDDLSFNDPYWTIGVGFSLLDGMVRLDFGWPIRRIGGSRAEIYTDGIF
ncbi:MAG: BamA/TamA family outer membrane protein, partial [Gemmatimonadetes bacterium]|nr:BamA/TamA family outer membrane protein [Gemmatimonadota bacterium]